jgi:hypothetical protein
MAERVGFAATGRATEFSSDWQGFRMGIQHSSTPLGAGQSYYFDAFCLRKRTNWELAGVVACADRVGAIMILY